MNVNYALNIKAHVSSGVCSQDTSKCMARIYKWLMNCKVKPENERPLKSHENNKKIQLEN